MISKIAEPSNITDVLLSEMRADPKVWRAYVAPGPREEEMMLYGLSDRVRYYWPRPAVQAALSRLYENVAAARPEPGIVAQAVGGLPGSAPAGTDLPVSIVRRLVGEVVRKYRAAAVE